MFHQRSPKDPPPPRRSKRKSDSAALGNKKESAANLKRSRKELVDDSSSRRRTSIADGGDDHRQQLPTSPSLHHSGTNSSDWTNLASALHEPTVVPLSPSASAITSPTTPKGADNDQSDDRKNGDVDTAGQSNGDKMSKSTIDKKQQQQKKKPKKKAEPTTETPTENNASKRKKKISAGKNVGGWVSPRLAQEMDRSWLEREEHFSTSFDLSKYVPQVGDVVL